MFSKTGDAVWISHLDLMRLFQRAFKRAGLPLTHSQGFNPRPSVSIALPLSVGVESHCELLDFQLDGVEIPVEELRERLNEKLIPGIRVLSVYDDGMKLKELGLLRCEVVMEYDRPVPEGAGESVRALFGRDQLLVEKKGKNGVTEQDILPMIRSLSVEASGDAIRFQAVVCCQDPSLNPMQLVAAVERYLPELSPVYKKVSRMELFDKNGQPFR
jgi:radical SAM-linked protein